MFVNNLMLLKEKLTTVTRKTTIGKALEIMEQNKFLSVPVVEGSKFYGSISKEKIYTYYYEKSIDKNCLLTDFIVENVMRTNVPVINPMQQVEEAAHFLETRSVSFVAVVDSNGDFVGIVTHHAIFHQFTELFGADKGRRLAVIAFDIQGQISKLAKIITENKGDIISFVVIDPKSLTEVKEIIIRLKTLNFDGIVAKVKAAGFKVE
ncbi:CBS domain-containing protein [Clostridium algoriphilum]|uniref:CBS domain-containing protein n=1 Tax=Clostridium algoriphilum TaxID=198347 RepID=UPI001CF12F6A|nr:CBS domain-containing protein [Clostridium algoriphilum]MCB2293209.1 CBS domain-containing protein [Clostridium algoriphilum]